MRRDPSCARDDATAGALLAPPIAVNQVLIADSPVTENESMTDSDLHPRPQLARARWIDLSGPWGFAYDDGDVGLDECWFERSDPFQRTVIVPFPPESSASGIGDPGITRSSGTGAPFRSPRPTAAGG